MTFAPGGGEISLMVRDPRGAADSASVNLDVQATDAPTAELISPTADGVYYSDELIAFQGRVSDTEDSVDALTISFETDADGDLGLELNVTSEGEVEAFGQLPEGEHAVRIKVVDSTGKDDMDSAVITVGPPNSAPTCTITSPEDSSTGPEGEEVRFEGTVDDVDVSPDWLSVEWESDKDGSMGSSSPDSDGTVGIAISTLSAQTHRVTLMATDEVGSTCTDSIYYTVGTPPVLNVTAPSDGGVLDHSEAVVFEATVEDNEDLPDAVGLSWESDIDGVFSTDGADSTGAVTVSVDSLSPGDHVVTVTATDTAGLVATDTVSFNLNQPPTAPTVTLEPDPATTDQTLIATATGSVDPEATATVTYTYAWFEDGLASFESTADTFPASATAKHRTYRVEVTATDGLVESTAGDAEATVVNSDPVLSGPTLSADEVAVGDVLTCTATATDIDPEDSPTVTYEWSDGSTGPTYTVTADDTVDSAITCTATADDSDGGTATGTASATVTNTAPIIDGVTISPDPAYNDDTLICTATATDADGDAPTMSYEWTGGATGPELPLTSIIAASGDSLTCTATATDADGGTASDTATVTIGNRAPTVDVSIDPAAPTRHDTLTCTASGITDPDDDATTISLAWTIDGAPAVASSSETESILEEAADAGQTVVCTATVDDGKGGIATATATVVITNTAPVVDSVTLSPENVYTNDTITAAVTTSDEDGDALTVAYAWYVDGSIVGESGSTISGATYFDKDDAVHVVVTPSDGTDSGDSVASDSITISNTAPSAPSVSIGPVEPIAGVDDIICSIDSGSSDADGDTVSYTITWDVDGTAFTGATTTTRTGDTISADETNGDEEWTCTVTPNDGDDDGTAGTASVTVQDCFEGWASTTNELSAADYSFVGEEADDWAGYFVSSAGDVDGDGFGDILVGANRNDDGGNRAGKAYLILGASLGSSGTIDLSAADYSFVGENADDFAGVSVSSAGDVDGDGLADLLVGAYGNDDGGTAAGKVYLILGASLGSDSTIELSSADYSFVGENLGDGAGRSISSAGDVDGDGLDDILVGAYSNDDGAINAGKTYLILGASLGSDSTIELSSADYNFVGENPGDYAGWSVSSSGDVDGDGLADLFVGAIYNDDGGDNAGKAYLILGASLGSDSTIELSSADYSFVGENGGDYACSSVSSAGDVDGDGLADLLVGAWRNDGGSSFGKAYLILGASLGDSSSIDLSEADYSFVGEESDARAGHSVSSAGDVDGDGLADLIVGAPAHNGGAINTGKAYLILGASLGSSSTIDLSSADYSFVGEGAEDYAGVSVSSAGDVNGDGLDDLFVGAMNNDDGGLNAGKTYLVLAPNACSTPPRGTEISISPASPTEGEDDLVCTIDTEAFDAEGDTITYTFDWTVDGVSYTGATTISETGDTIPGSATSAYEEWTCTVTPNDGESDGISVSTSVTVGPEYVGAHGGTMILIDAQTFEMGCTAGMSSCGSDESPAHDVTLTNDFYIGETEVTQGEYESMMGTNPSLFTSCGSDSPVEQVSWHESAVFANAVSDSEGLEQCYTCTGSGSSTICTIAVEPYSCGGYRLPTEAEWEAAARCGEDTLYAGSTVIGDVAWYNSNSGSTTHTVATKASNACGLYDMSGNTWEWTQDWYSSSYYSSSPGTDPVGATSGTYRVYRGGSWNYTAAYARVANRAYYPPVYRYGYLGFRLVRTSP
jgi:formylglycine-generating enzyme required for sulfatase activity